MLGARRRPRLRTSNHPATPGRGGPIATAALLLAAAPDSGMAKWLLDLLRDVATVWTFQLATIDGRTLTVGKVATALLVLAIGAPIARVAMRRLARRVLARVGIEAGAADAFATLGFYVVLAFLAVFALWVSEIPLTVFTLAGGALAIGIGFGSQNVLNNFISGLIILAERPIKVGDLIEVAGTFGQVEHIGGRSTRVRTFDNTHIIVPNSTFLENNVLNWTHSDNLVRIRLDVGVAYGSPTRRVEELILAAIDEHPKTVSPPEPIVLFSDFGDSALAFQALFWIEMRRPMDQRQTLSDIRFRLDELFRSDGITVAFPQRDVHLDTAAPLAVRLVREDGG